MDTVVSSLTLSPALRDIEGGTRETKARHPRSQYPFCSERASHLKKNTRSRLNRQKKCVSEMGKLIGGERTVRKELLKLQERHIDSNWTN